MLNKVLRLRYFIVPHTSVFLFEFEVTSNVQINGLKYRKSDLCINLINFKEVSVLFTSAVHKKKLLMWVMSDIKEMSEDIQSRVVDLHKVSFGTHQSTVRGNECKWTHFSAVDTLPVQDDSRSIFCQHWNTIPVVKYDGRSFMIFGCFATAGPGPPAISKNKIYSTFCQNILSDHHLKLSNSSMMQLHITSNHRSKSTNERLQRIQSW